MLEGPHPQRQKKYLTDDSHNTNQTLLGSQYFTGISCKTSADISPRDSSSSLGLPLGLKMESSSSSSSASSASSSPSVSWRADLTESWTLIGDVVWECFATQVRFGTFFLPLETFFLGSSWLYVNAVGWPHRQSGLPEGQSCWGDAGFITLMNSILTSSLDNSSSGGTWGLTISALTRNGNSRWSVDNSPGDWCFDCVTKSKYPCLNFCIHLKNGIIWVNARLTSEPTMMASAGVGLFV